MTAHLEVWSVEGTRLVALEGGCVSVGSRWSNDVVLAADGVSALHCALVAYAGGWTLRDLGPATGTLLNGRRVWGERALHDGDQILAGAVTLCFRSDDADSADDREQAVRPPVYLTRRERDVLLTLCTPVGGTEAFTGPAGVREVAERLHVSQAAVRQHLLRLAAKLGVTGEGESRRIGIANEALRRGLVSVAELGAPHPATERASSP